MPGPSSVSAYIAAQPPPAQPVLRRVRAAILKALPGASEGISYQIPIYKLDGRMVLYFAGFRGHYSIYPATERLVSTLGDELAGILHNRATLRFPYTGAFPARLISRIAKLRAAEAKDLTLAKASKKRPAKKKPAKKTPAKMAPAKKVPAKKAPAKKTKAKPKPPKKLRKRLGRSGKRSSKSG